jgi:tetraacyldisaccharide 4'-kinase
MQYLNIHWRQFTWLSFLLLPVSMIYYFISSLRRVLYKLGIFKKVKVNAPVIIVGNISVGGTGKTPLVIWLVKLLQKNNFRPGVVSRGYGRKKGGGAFVVKAGNTALETGDEPALIYKNCQCPVVVDADRPRGAQMLVTDYDCNIIISDDGLQHYKLARELEIAVIDGVRGHGNRLCLPAGPLREPASRLNKVDAVVVNNPSVVFGHKHEYKMTLVANDFINVFDRSQARDKSYFNDKTVNAVAGIGNPEQFFDKLNALGMNVIKHPFPDHYNYCTDDITFSEYPVIMTEKDAVKLWNNESIKVADKSQYWYLPVTANLSSEFELFVINMIKEKVYG